MSQMKPSKIKARMLTTWLSGFLLDMDSETVARLSREAGMDSVKPRDPTGSTDPRYIVFDRVQSEPINIMLLLLCLEEVFSQDRAGDFFKAIECMHINQVFHKPIEENPYHAPVKRKFTTFEIHNPERISPHPERISPPKGGGNYRAE